MKLKDYLIARKNATNPAKINLRNILAVIQAWFRKKRRSIAGFELEDHMYEQIIWRRTEVKELAPKCWKDGACKVCGCEVLGKTMEDRACEGNCYPAMMEATQWELYKQLHKIKLFN